MSNEGARFCLTLKNIWEISGMIKNTVGDGYDEDNNNNNNEQERLEENSQESSVMIIEIPKASTAALEQVVAFANHYATEPMTPIAYPYRTVQLNELVQPWYQEFCQKATQPIPGHEAEGSKLFYELVEAADYMEIVPLLDITQVVVSAWIKSKTPEELKAMIASVEENEAAAAAAAEQPQAST